MTVGIGGAKDAEFSALAALILRARSLTWWLGIMKAQLSGSCEKFQTELIYRWMLKSVSTQRSINFREMPLSASLQRPGISLIAMSSSLPTQV